MEPDCTSVPTAPARMLSSTVPIHGDGAPGTA